MPQAPCNIDHALTPERVLWRTQTAALVRVLGKKKAERFLRAMAVSLADAQSYAEAVPLRADKAKHASRQAAVEGAVEVFRAELPVLLASIPR